jgi:histidine triad (HIT) family protein
MADDCVFCRIAKGEIPSTKVYENESFLAFRDIHPAAPVHLLVIPKKHIARLSEAVPADAEILGGLLLAVGTVARREKLDHYRLIINDGAGAGQTVFHLHAHILSGVGVGEKLL